MVAVAISIAALVVKGGPNYGLDFRGGTQILVRFDPKPPIDELRRVLSAKARNVSLQEAQGTGEFIIATEFADEKKLEEARQLVEAALREKYANFPVKWTSTMLRRRHLQIACKAHCRPSARSSCKVGQGNFGLSRPGESRRGP